MKRTLGLVLAGGLVLTVASSAKAQFGLTIGNPYNGGLSIGTGGYAYGNPGYYAAPSTYYYSSGYQGWAPRAYGYRTYATPYAVPAYGYRSYGNAYVYPQYRARGYGVWGGRGFRGWRR